MKNWIYRLDTFLAIFIMKSHETINLFRRLTYRKVFCVLVTVAGSSKLLHSLCALGQAQLL